MSLLFKRQTEPPQVPIEYPDGVLVDSGEHVYYIRGGKRYRLYSDRAAGSWGIDPIRGSEQSLANYPRARAPLGFRDGTLIQNFSDGKLYVISGNKRRQVTSPDVLARFGWRERDALVVSDEETALHDEGERLA
jgi:hypothetical protein